MTCCVPAATSEGPAADEAQGDVDAAEFTARQVAGILHDATETAAFGADQLNGLHRKTFSFVRDARDDGFTVDEALSITDASGTREEQSARQAQAEEHAESVQLHATQPLTMDNEYGAKLDIATEPRDTITMPPLGLTPFGGHRVRRPVPSG